MKNNFFLDILNTQIMLTVDPETLPRETLGYHVLLDIKLACIRSGRTEGRIYLKSVMDNSDYNITGYFIELARQLDKGTIVIVDTEIFERIGS